MKIFLYGKRRSGKSTIINSVLGGLKLVPSGFRTVSDSPGVEGDWNLYITDAGADAGPKYKVASCRSDGSWESFGDVFDSAGVKLLEFSRKPQIVIMDELGFMEHKALLFQRRVLEVLDGDYSVLGVVKPEPNVFLQNVTNHPGVLAVEVTEENRKDVLKLLIEKYRYLI